MKPEGITHFLWLLIFSMLLHTLPGALIPHEVKKTLCENGHLGVTQEYCNYPPVKGDCKLILTRFYYNILTFMCEPFIFSGCGGNRNNFKHKFHCEEYCIPEVDRGQGRLEA